MIYRNFGRPAFAMGLVIIAALMPLNSANAQSAPEPAAVIAFASVDDQLNDIEYLAAATSETFGQMSGIARLQAEGFLPGVDFDKPMGALLYFSEGNPEPKSIGFVPVNNIDDVLDKISEFAELEEDGDIVTILPDAGEELTLKSQNGYAFVSSDPELLENLPKDPNALIAAQAKEYNISAVISPQRIPKDLRQQAIDFIRQGYEATMQDMDDLQASIQEAQFDMQMKQMEMMINEFDQITIGFNADKKTERVYIDMNMKGVENSDMAKRLLSTKTKVPSKFAGFLMENAAMTMHNCSGISKEDAKMYMDSFDNMRDIMLDEITEESDESKAKVLSDITNRISAALKKTFEGGVLDAGGVVFTNDDGINVAFGAQIADARELEKSIKEIVAEAGSSDGDIKFDLNSGKHAGFTLHNIAVNLPLDELDDVVGDVFGETVTIILGINESQVYAAAGNNPEPILKKAIDANAGSVAKPETIGQYNFYVAPIMKKVSDIQDEEMMEMMSDEILESGKDRVRVTYDVVGGEMKFRLEIQDGIFKMLGVAGQMMNGMGGGGADF